MTRADPSSTPVGRALAGVFAGGIFGLIAQLLFNWDGPPEHGIRVPVVGPVVGAGVGAVLAVAVGARALPGWLRRVAVGVLGGVVLGALGGAFVYAPLMASLDLAGDDVFRGKVQAAYQSVGVVFGIPLGALVGLVAVGVWSLFQRAGPTVPKQTPQQTGHANTAPPRDQTPSDSLS